MNVRAPDFWRSDGPISAALTPLAALYTAGGVLRRALVEPRRAAVPVICVGNLVAGGAGKTPVALSLARELRVHHRIDAHLLAKGYGGRERGPLRVDPATHDAAAVGDEALLLAAAAPTWVARDRRGAVRVAAQAGAEMIVLDDGFQDPSLAKDLSLVVVDGGYGFGNARVLPAGPLREPVGAGLARADAVVLVGSDTARVAETLPPGLPLLRTRLVPAPGAERLAGKAVFAFAGIGRPEKFFTTLGEIGCRVVATRSFPDHHPYRPEEIMQVCEEAATLGAVPVTTAKDAVRLPPSARAMVETFSVTLEWSDPDALEALLAPLLDQRRLRKACPA